MFGENSWRRFLFLKHLGLGYRRETFAAGEISGVAAGKREKLNNRRWENGIQIAVVKVDYDSIGVDSGDVVKVEKFLAANEQRINRRPNIYK